MHFTVPWDYSGHPTLTIPIGVSRPSDQPGGCCEHSGLPLVFQLVGNRLQEQLLCQLGHAYEVAVGRGSSRPLLPPLVASPGPKL